MFTLPKRVLPPQLTLRSWIHSEENKRRTLQRSDIATAIARTEVYDFLIVRSTCVLVLLPCACASADGTKLTPFLSPMQDIVPQTAEAEDGDAAAAA